MLGKLLKYEIPAVGRKLVPLYIGWAATAVLLGIMIGPLQERSEFMTVISALMYAGVATAVFVMAIIMIVQRYSNSLLGNEGYFSHVLPVTTNAHIASKTISAMLWTFLSMLALAVTGLIIAIFSGWIVDIFSVNWAEFFRELFRRISANEVIIFIEVLIASVLSLTKSILTIYAAITIGHQTSNHTGLVSIAAYIGIVTLESMVANVLFHLFPSGLITPDTAGGVIVILLICIVVSLILGGAYFYICKYLMEKKLNLN